MSPLLAQNDAQFHPSWGAVSAAWPRGALPCLLAAGCAAAVAAGLWTGSPDSLLKADPELAGLLRGMAMIKALVVLAALTVLIWRLQQPITGRLAAAYLLGAWLASGATAMVWQLSSIPLAALLFHAGEIGMLLTAWRDRGRSRAARA